MKKILVFGLILTLIIGACQIAVFAANVPGDIYTDGHVDSKDAVRLAQYLAKWNVQLSADELAAADVYSDETVNSKDAVKLAQYLAMWNVTLGDKTSADNPSTTVGDIEIDAGEIFN